MKNIQKIVNSTDSMHCARYVGTGQRKKKKKKKPTENAAPKLCKKKTFADDLERVHGIIIVLQCLTFRKKKKNPQLDSQEMTRNTTIRVPTVYRTHVCY